METKGSEKGFYFGPAVGPWYALLRGRHINLFGHLAYACTFTDVFRH